MCPSFRRGHGIPEATATAKLIPATFRPAGKQRALPEQRGASRGEVRRRRTEPGSRISRTHRAARAASPAFSASVVTIPHGMSPTFCGDVRPAIAGATRTGHACCEVVRRFAGIDRFTDRAT
jgi:hypothetical protein